MLAMTSLVHYDVADALATITLDSQHNRNALSRQLVTELFEHLEAAEADAAVRVVLIRAEGPTSRRRPATAWRRERAGSSSCSG
jgi:enoyl-CoA hydratase/carnithine racemase